METQIIEIFCIVDDLLKIINFKDDRQAKMSSAEIITVVASSALYFGGNHEKSRKFFKDFKLIKKVLYKGQFNRRLHAIPENIWQRIFYLISMIFKQKNVTQEYAIDSFPVQVCKNIRINRCHLYEDEIYRGWNASKKEYFFGIKVHMICTLTGEPVEFIFAPGSVSDAKVFKDFDFDLPEKSKVYGDGMYNDYNYEKLVKEALNIYILPARKENMKEQHDPALKFLINRMRKNIETTFSRITTLFPKKIHAVTSKGFELKVFSFILAYALTFL